MAGIIPHSKPSISHREIGAARRVVASGMLGCGPETAAFEAELSEFLSRPVALVSSGTAALHLALILAGIEAGDSVAIPTHVCPSVLYAVQYVHAQPRLYDSGPLGIGINTDSFLEAARTSRAAVIVHTYGFPTIVPDTAPPVPIIEDCAHALGAQVGNNPVGGKKFAGVFSFYSTKMIAAGECAALASNETNIRRARKIRSPRGADEARTHYPYSPSDISAAIGRIQLQRLETFLDRRRQLAYRYMEAFRNLPVHLPREVPPTQSSWYRFIIETPYPRRKIITMARKKDVTLGEGVRTPLHRLLHEDARRFPHSEHAWKHTVSLPIYPALTDLEAERVIAVVSSLMKTCRIQKNTVSHPRKRSGGSPA